MLKLGFDKISINKLDFCNIKKNQSKGLLQSLIHLKSQ